MLNMLRKKYIYESQLLIGMTYERPKVNDISHTKRQRLDPFLFSLLYKKKGSLGRLIVRK